MKKKLYIILLLMPLILSCSSIDSISSKQENNVTVKFLLTTAKMGGLIGTKTMDLSTTNENKIDNIWVLQFQNGTLKKKTYYSSVSSMSLDVSLASGTSNIYFIANVGQTELSSFTSDESTFETTVKTLNAESDVLYTSVSGEKYIPMLGSLTSYAVPSSGCVTGQSIALTRILARLDVHYTINLSNFELRTIRVCNVPQSIQYYIPQTSIFPVSPSVISTAYSNIGTVSGTLIFYLPENMRGIGGNTASDATASGKVGVEHATYIELVGYTKAENGGDEVTYKIYPGTDDINDYNIKRNTCYTVNANINGISTSDSRLKITPRANCYMLKPGASIYIPVKRANESDLGTQLSNVTTGWTPNVEWQTATNLVTVAAVSTDQACGMFKVTAGTNTGNAVVSIKNSDHILWSWHIWVTDYDPNTTNVVFNNLTWMDRNLGAMSNTITSSTDKSSYGLYYQWGRKDPFQGSTTQITKDPGNGNNFAYSVQHPADFLYAGGSNNDWYTNTTQNNTLWNTNKTVYDPCPGGWKVPPREAWSSLTVTNFTKDANEYGRTYTDNPSFSYPFNGFVWYDGNLPENKTIGRCWASFSRSPYCAFDFDFNSSSLQMREDWRGFACSVRCVKE